MKIIVIITVQIFFFLSVSFNCPAQQQVNDIESRVPELEEFHEVIYPIWHTAFPKKDISALKSYAGVVNEKAKRIYSAKLPGILRDKQEKWNLGVRLFKKAVDDYSLRAEGGNNDEILMSAEKLHAEYEMLVKIIRPPLKEINSFHQTLYLVYHNYLPEEKYVNILKAAKELEMKAEAITKVKLTKFPEPQKIKISSSASDLYSAVKELNNVKSDADPGTIKILVERIHSKYQVLADIF